jgi:hypothetical protein
MSLPSVQENAHQAVRNARQVSVVIVYDGMRALFNTPSHLHIVGDPCAK